ncbi:putative DnaJ domain, Chaperone J-domain superfamily [Helianthus anomalus]
MLIKCLIYFKCNCAELEGDADDEEIKLAYRRLAKFYHLDVYNSKGSLEEGETVLLFLSYILYMFVVYNGKGSLEEGETAEARFIKIQAAYELLIDNE